MATKPKATSQDEAARSAAPDFDIESAITNFSVCIHKGYLIVVFVDLRRGYYGFHVIAPNMEWSECENAERCKSVEAAIKVAKCMIDLNLAMSQAL